MNALEIHIITAVIFAISLMIVCLNQISVIKNVDNLSVKKMAITLVFATVSSISAFASISALLIHLFGK